MKKDAEKAVAACKTLFPRTEYGWGWDESEGLQSALIAYGMDDFGRSKILAEWWIAYEQADITFRIVLSREI